MVSVTLPGVKLPNVFDAYGDSVLARVLAEKKPPATPEPAEIRWGKAPQFNYVPLNPTTTVIWPSDPGLQQQNPADPNQQEPPPLQYEEIWRAEQMVRIENPQDSEQYVIVTRITSIIFRGPDNRQHQFNFHPPQ